MATSYGTPIAQSFPKFQHPSHELLKENNFVWQVYHKYHAKCLKGTRTLLSALLASKSQVMVAILSINAGIPLFSFQSGKS